MVGNKYKNEIIFEKLQTFIFLLLISTLSIEEFFVFIFSLKHNFLDLENDFIGLGKPVKSNKIYKINKNYS